jgi:hypothetical protein
MRVATYVTNLSVALVFAAAYMACYVYFLSFQFGYMGFSLYPRSSAILALSVFICLVPVLCYRGLRAMSSALAVFTYVLLYVPIILTFALGSSRSLEETLLIQLTFMACMCLLFMTDVIVVRNPFDLHTKLELIEWVFVLTIISSLYVLFVYRSNLRLVSFAEVYEQRAANEELGAGLLIRYLSSWLYTVLIPLCLAYGLVTKKYKYFAVGAAACLSLYLATAAKSAVVLPLIYAGVFGLFARNRLRLIYPLLLGTLSLVMCVLLTVTDTSSVAFVISSLVLMRTVGSAGLLTTRYYDFFATHPHTTYTHVNLVKMISGAYPYGNLQVGQVVGQYYFAADMNANANFWAMDGIAALGLPGVAVSSVLCALLFMLMNSATRGYNKLFVVLCFLPFLVSLFNTSLLSSIWSGGGLFLMLFFVLNKRNPKGITEGALSELVGKAERRAFGQ